MRWREDMLSVTVLLAALVSVQAQDYVVPNALVEAVKPKGLRVSIPDQAGIELMAFHGNLNKAITVQDAGAMSRDVVKAKNERWVFENLNVKLKAGDKIHFWLYVQFDGQGYESPVTVWTYAGDTAGACAPTHTTLNGQPSCAGQLILDEQFNKLDTKRWQYDVRMPHGPDWEFLTHMISPDSAYIQNAQLVIKPVLLSDIFDKPDFITRGKLQLQACTGKVGTEECVKQATGGRNILAPIVTTRIRSKDGFSFRYGRVEVRAKMPNGDWLFPEIWLSPKDRLYGTDYESGQIRLAFARGNEALNARLGAHIGNKVLEGGVVMGISRTGQQPVVKRQMTSKLNTEAWSKQFRNYSLVWTPDDMKFSVDGQLYATVTPPAGGFKNFPEFAGITRNPWEGGTKMAPFDKEFYVRVGVGVGGIRAFPDNTTSAGKPKPWKNSDPKAMANFWRSKANWYPTWSSSELRVDYIKIWAL